MTPLALDHYYYFNQYSTFLHKLGHWPNSKLYDGALCLFLFIYNINSQKKIQNEKDREKELLRERLRKSEKRTKTRLKLCVQFDRK